MRKPNISLLMLLLFLCSFARAQEVYQTKGQQFSLSEFLSQEDNFATTKAEDKYFLHLRFSQIPTGDLLQQLKSQQIQLLQHQSENVYLAAIPVHFLPSQLFKLGIESLAIPVAENKLSPELKNGDLPAWSTTSGTKVDLAIYFHEETSKNHIDKIVQKFGIEELEGRRSRGLLVLATVDKKNIEALSHQPTIASLDYVQEKEQKLNFECRSVQGVGAIQSDLPGEINLRGHGVVIGIGDGGELGDHVDLKNRVFNEASGTYSSFGAHGDHVSGIVAGSGYLNPRHRGIAPNAQIITQKTSLVTYYSEDYYKDYGMVLTNNSYGTTSKCEINGKYNYSSQSLDKQMNDLHEVLHVFAAGNSGWETCGDYPKSYHTVLRYYQAAKNVLTVGNVKDNRAINPNSSRGPVLDGRIKPEICGVGTSVMSTDRENGYWSATGTSMSSPAVVATIGLMVQRYRENNNGENPEGALMKAIACNSADDLGNAGPDYTFGYGLINAINAINTLDDDNFQSDHIENGTTNTHEISIPAGVEKVKIMLYWHDKEADAATATTALVNDLDLKVKTPENQSFLPWILDPSPANVENTATRGADHLNNMEQVTIDNPAAGNYQLEIKGFDVPFGPQKYYLTYEFIRSEVKLIYPIGGEGLEPGKTEKIRWSADESNTQQFLAEWSGDNGATWNLIKGDVGADARQVSWKTPMTATGEALVRVTKVGTGVSDVSNTVFSVLGTPTNLTAQPVCTGYVDLHWSEVAGATAYQVMMLKGEEMVVMESTTDTTLLIEGGLTIGEQFWFSVRSMGTTASYSQRAVAVSCIPEIVGACDWDNDATINASINKLRGREKTYSALTSGESISVEIENIGANDLHEMTIYYQVNGEAPVSEIINSLLLKGDTETFTFTQKADLSKAGEYSIDVWVEVPGDIHPENDHIAKAIEAVQLNHPQLRLPMLETFNDLEKGHTYTESYVGPRGLNLWDMELGEGSLAFATEADGEGMGLTIGNTGTDNGIFENKAILNLEFSGLKNTEEPIYLVFKYKSNEKVFTLSEKPIRNENAFFIRGSENDNWIEVAVLPVGEKWEQFDNINLTRILTSEGQTFSNSSQIMFQQVGNKALVLDDVSISSANRLPVTLDTFSAEKFGEYAKLKWTTRTEEGNDFFVIEMAEGVDAVQRGDFRAIGQVKGQGFSQTLQEYEFMDTEENKQGDRYYRLKQVDFGGQATASEFRVVSFSEVQREVSFFPNPFRKDLSLSLKSKIDQTVYIRIYDGKGQEIAAYQEQFQKGRQELPISVEENLATGLYTVQLTFADKTNQSYRISKIRD